MFETGQRGAIDEIKQTAIRHLQALDPKVRLRTTDYFNHSFAPDLVVRWDHDSSHERFVYLRVTDRAPEFQLDLDTVADQHPIILGMNGIEHQGSEEAILALSSSAVTTDTFVSELDALGELADSRRDSPYAALVSGSVAKGGRGVLLEEDARGVTTSIEQGFKGAKALDTESVARAARTVDHFLSGTHASRLNRLLQAVWVGAGGSGATFPSDITLSETLDVDALAFLLELPEVADPEFWRRLGRRLEVKMLAQLVEPHRSPNFHHLVGANLDVLVARACHVVDSDLFHEQQDGWRWVAENGAFGIQGRDLTAYVAERADELAAVPGTKSDGVAVDRLRARSEGRVLTSVSISDGRESGGLQNLEGEDVVQGERLSALAEAWGPSALIRKASVLLPMGATMSLDFMESSASSVTRSRFNLADLLGTAIPLLRDIAPDDAAALQRFITPEPRIGEQDSVFDLLDE